MGGIDLANGVVGAVLGMLVAVLFQDPIQNSWYRLRARSKSAVRGLRRREESSPVWRTFSLGPLHTSALIVEGDGESSIPAQAVYIQVLDQEIELPPDMAGWRAEIEEESARLQAEGRTPLWNGPRYAVETVGISRTALDEQPEIHLRLRPTDYYTFLAAQQLDRRLADGTTPRSRYLDPDDPLSAPAFLQCSFAVNIAVVTADDILIVTQRSNRVRMASGVWNSSVNEGMSRHIDSSGRSAPDLYAVARRGMREELAIEPHEYALEMLALVLDIEKRQWSALLCPAQGRELRRYAGAYQQRGGGQMGTPDHRFRSVPPFGGHQVHAARRSHSPVGPCRTGALPSRTRTCPQPHPGGKGRGADNSPNSVNQ
ncbi:hypothetical protein [Streptomyces sp. cg40]|uniref:hypothetical protein n=1 Tax=Streptomyces sp. cg40 TaxID=3419764 RepID=UPI003D06153D